MVLPELDSSRLEKTIRGTFYLRISNLRIVIKKLYTV